MRRLVTRATLLPNSKTMLIETPHVFMPFSKVRVTSAPLSKVSLSKPLYTGKGICRRLLLLKFCRSVRCVALAGTIPLYSIECQRSESCIHDRPRGTIPGVCKGLWLSLRPWRNDEIEIRQIIFVILHIYIIYAICKTENPQSSTNLDLLSPMS